MPSCSSTATSADFIKLLSTSSDTESYSNSGSGSEVSSINLPEGWDEWLESDNDVANMQLDM